MGIIDEIKIKEIRDNNILQGGITAETVNADNEDDVFKAIRDFKGDGWCCSTDFSGVKFFKKGEIEAEPGAWPVCAEAVNGKKSLSVVRNGSNWYLVYTEKSDGEGIIETKEYLKEGGGKLRYEICWKKIDVEGIKEYRPVVSRLAGIGEV